jgi:hypothetical protein
MRAGPEERSMTVNAYRDPDVAPIKTGPIPLTGQQIFPFLGLTGWGDGSPLAQKKGFRRCSLKRTSPCDGSAAEVTVNVDSGRVILAPN